MSDKTGGTESEEIFDSRARLADSSEFDHTNPPHTSSIAPSYTPTLTLQTNMIRNNLTQDQCSRPILAATLT